MIEQKNIQFASYYSQPLKELELKFMKVLKLAHLGLTILILFRHFMVQLLDPLLTCLDPKTMSWSLFLMVSCEGYRGDFPGAQKEVESIAIILNTISLIGRQATRAEAMRRMSSVGVIHIVALADKYTREIVLSPNPGWTSRFPLKKDYFLKRSDVQAANL